MTKPVPLLEAATVENFDPVRYKLANPDLAGCNDPREHFKLFGIRESRMQISCELLRDSAYRKRKFSLFSHVLAFPNQKINSFPAVFGGEHYELEEYQAESANAEFGEFVSEIERSPDRLFLNLGCGLRHIHYDNCLYVEVYPSLSADLIVTPELPYPIRSSSLDGIGCFAVLEHTRRPWQVVEEMNRMLKPGGRVFIDWPFLQPTHGFPSHFFNATREGLTSLFTDNGFEIEVANTYPHQWPSFTVNWILGKLLDDLPRELSDEFRELKVGELVRREPLGEFWRRVVAAMSDDKISEFACGNSLIGTKK